eukprot:4513997-Alexandrium_andersonii.AAC.2
MSSPCPGASIPNRRSRLWSKQPVSYGGSALLSQLYATAWEHTAGAPAFRTVRTASSTEKSRVRSSQPRPCSVSMETGASSESQRRRTSVTNWPCLGEVDVPFLNRAARERRRRSTSSTGRPMHLSSWRKRMGRAL